MHGEIRNTPRNVRTLCARRLGWDLSLQAGWMERFLERDDIIALWTEIQSHYDRTQGKRIQRSQLWEGARVAAQRFRAKVEPVKGLLKEKHSSKVRKIL